MKTRIGLMGLGRVGRNLFRLLYRDPELELVAISDLADLEALVYLLKWDTLLGRFPEAIDVSNSTIWVAGRQVRMLKAEHPGDANWGELGVDIVVEATAQNRTRADMEKHLAAGAKRVLLCSPPKDPPDRTIILGVNDGDLEAGDRIVSNASCTAHAAAPLLQVLEREFGVERAFLSTIHAYTNQQRLADVPAEDKRRGRAAAENIIPQATDAAEVIVKLLPQLRGKLTAAAVNVPVANGSAVDLVCWHPRPVSVDSINAAVRAAAEGPLAGILDYEVDPIVSSDVLHTPESGTFDSQATMTIGTGVSKTLCWFDNSWGYAHRAVELLRRMAAFDGGKEEAR
jgi:glyceraldehyde 3-phosphate dehydrogenase